MQRHEQVQVDAGQIIHERNMKHPKNEFPFVILMDNNHFNILSRPTKMTTSLSFATLPLAVAAFVAGALVPLQGGSNAALGRALGHPLWASVASLTVSLLAVLPVLLATRANAPLVGDALQRPLWMWLGGLAGVIYITLALILTPRLGATTFIVCVVAGQMLASLLIDHYGLMGPRSGSRPRPHRGRRADLRGNDRRAMADARAPHAGRHRRRGGRATRTATLNARAGAGAPPPDGRQPASFFSASSTASPLNGFTIQPFTPAALPRSFIAGLLSVVSITTLTVAFASSPRIFSTIVRPSMFGMFTSLITRRTPASP